MIRYVETGAEAKPRAVPTVATDRQPATPAAVQGVPAKPVKSTARKGRKAA